MQDYRAVSPTVLADGHHLCETGFATSVTLQLDVSLADGHHLCETGFATSVTLQLDVSLADGHHLCETGFATSVTLQLDVSLQMDTTSVRLDLPHQSHYS